jgi:hypothetical protein
VRDHPELHQLLPQARVPTREAQPFRLPVLERPRLLDQPPQRMQLGALKAEPGARVEDEVGLAAGQRCEQWPERHVLPADSHGDVEVEPVVAPVLTDLVGRHLDLRGFIDLRIVERRALDREQYVVTLLEPWQHLAHEDRGGKAAHQRFGHEPQTSTHRHPQPGNGIEQGEAREQGGLGCGVAGHPLAAPDDRHADDVVAHGIGEAPAQAAAVAGLLEPHGQAEPGWLDHREGHGVVGGPERRTLAQRGVVDREEPRQVVGRHLERITADKPRHRRIEHGLEPRQDQTAV